MTLPDEKQPQMTAVEPLWLRDTRRLRICFRLYLTTCAVGLVCTVVPGSWIVYWIWNISGVANIMLLIGCLVFGFRVQSRLNRAGVSRVGAWVIVVGTMGVAYLMQGCCATNGQFLVVWLLGSIVPIAVLRKTRSLEQSSPTVDRA